MTLASSDLRPWGPPLPQKKPAAVVLEWAVGGPSKSHDGPSAYTRDK